MPFGQSVDEHLKGCSHCAELFQNGAVLGRRLGGVVTGQAPASLAQLAATESLIAAEHGVRAFLRSRSTRVRWALSLALPTLLLVREALRRRLPWRDLGTPRLLAGLLLLGFLGVVSLSALRPLPAGRRAARLRIALALVAWCLPCVLWLAPETRASADDLSGNFALGSLRCFAYGSALAAPSFALLWAFDRGVRVPYRVWALGAGTVALVANLILLVHCQATHGAHLLAGHFSIGLIWFSAASSAVWWARRVE